MSAIVYNVGTMKILIMFYYVIVIATGIGLIVKGVTSPGINFLECFGGSALVGLGIMKLKEVSKW